MANAVFNDIPASKPIYGIGPVSEILHVHQRTLRIYNQEGLLVPQRSPKNRRLYCLNDIERGKFIQYLTRELGINLSGIKIIFNLLEKQGIKPDQYISLVSKIAEEVNITTETQAENREKLSRRGRKKGA